MQENLGGNSDNFSDAVSNLELLERAKNEFSKERRAVLKSLPTSITVEEIRVFVSDFDVQDVVLHKSRNEAVVTLTDSIDTQKMVTKLNGTTLLYVPISLSVHHSDSMLCVIGLPTSLSEWKFREFMSEQGTIEKCFLMRSSETGESKGYGFVEYTEPREKCNLIRLNFDWMTWEDRVLQCEYVTERVLEYDQLQSRCLLINNLPRDYKEVMDLRALFSEFTSPVYCQIVMKEGESLGFGLIEYTEAADAEKIMKHLQGHKIKDTELDIIYCAPGRSAVYMFNRLMVKYGEKVVTSRASLLPDPVYPNPAFLKHSLYKSILALKATILTDFKNYLTTLQQGYIRQLESKTNSKPGLLGPAPSIPMSPLMDMGLQLGLLSVIALDLKERKEITEELPVPLNTLTVTGPQSGSTEAGKPSLLGDPMSAQANIVLTSLLSAVDSTDPMISIADAAVKIQLLGKPVIFFNIGLLTNLGHLIGAITDQSQSTGILGSGPRPLMEGFNQMGDDQDGLLGVAPPNMKPNFMNTVKSLALQKLTETHGNQPQLLNALFGNSKSGDMPEDNGNRDTGILGRGPSMMEEPYSQGGGMMENMGEYGNDAWGYRPRDSGYGYHEDDYMGSGDGNSYGKGMYDDTYRGRGRGGYGTAGPGYREPRGRRMLGRGSYGSDYAGYSGDRGRGDTQEFGRRRDPGHSGGMGSSAGYGRGGNNYDCNRYEESEYQGNNNYGDHYGNACGSHGDQYSSKYQQSKASYSYGSERKERGRSDQPDRYASSNFGQNADYGTKRSYSGMLANSATSGYSATNYSSGYYGMGSTGASSSDNYYTAPQAKSLTAEPSKSSLDGKKADYQNMAQQAAAYAAYTSYSNYMGSYQGGYSGSYNSSATAMSPGYSSSKQGNSMPPPLPPGTGGSGVMSTPQGQKRNSNHLLPSPEPSPEGDYIGQHSQGIGGHYAESYAKRQKLNDRF